MWAHTPNCNNKKTIFLKQPCEMFLCKFAWNNCCMKSVIKRIHNEETANEARRMPLAAIFKKPPKWFACRQGVVYKKRNRCVWFIPLPLPTPPHSFEDLNPLCQAKKPCRRTCDPNATLQHRAAFVWRGWQKHICVTGSRLIYQFSLFRMAAYSTTVFFICFFCLFVKKDWGFFFWKFQINQINNQIDSFLGQC
jgi:hypothetical protein